MIADPAHLMTQLERFEREAWRCAPAYAEKVRRHLRRKLAALHDGEPLIEPLDDDVFGFEDFDGLDVGVPDEAEVVLLDDEPAGRAVLIVAEGTPEEAVIPLGEVLHIGRGGQNDLTIRGDNKVSRYHCQLVRHEGQWSLVDLKSANGTLVNGEVLTPKQPRRLYGGEELILGNTFVRFRWIG